MPIQIRNINPLIPLGEPIIFNETESLQCYVRKPSPAQLDALRRGYNEAGDSLEKQISGFLLPVLADWDAMDGDEKVPITEETLRFLHNDLQQELVRRAQSMLFPSEESLKNDEKPSEITS